MAFVDKLEKLYADYLRDMKLGQDVNGGLREFFNVLVMGNRGQDVFNIRFAQDVENAMGEFDAEADEPREVIKFVLEKSAEYFDDISVGMMFTAMHKFITPLVAVQSAEYRADIARWYDTQFPKNRRTPVMNDFRKALN